MFGKLSRHDDHEMVSPGETDIWLNGGISEISLPLVTSQRDHIGPLWTM